MDNRVYYGEYSLQHWIDLILKNNIVLPVYQRYFVWEEKQVYKLIETFNKNEFVPPVTIGAFKNGNTTQNLILDGQQRLTSILLAYLGLFPDREAYKKTIARFASEDDQPEEIDELENVIDWTFAKLLEKGKDKISIHSAVAAGHYKTITAGVDSTFLKSKFLGFSYLVPNVSDDKVQQKFYSSVFRNINIQGTDLYPEESRKSFYFLNTSLSDFFDPAIAENYSVKAQSQTRKLDFVRYLALLSQYKKDGNSDSIARGYKSKMEQYYEQYIYEVVGEVKTSMFVDFATAFPLSDYRHRFVRLALVLKDLDLPTEFPSIIDADVYFFGIINWIIIEDKTIDVTHKDKLKGELASSIDKFRKDGPHQKSPSALKYLKLRMDSSIEIYKKYKDE